ncbi:hypothetical protein HAX54_007693 [Datura stramonium]|uniref:Uncharacterized protein n=1 Tax=Datura stramonium TaxID=4076 RepID=A0ABS8WXF1_DATST|nr:hypothetical protein [Datura stramonium]
MQCDIQAKKGWGPICAYITKEDKNPHIWGNTSKAHVMEVAEAYEGKKKAGCSSLLTVSGFPLLSPCILRLFLSRAFFRGSHLSRKNPGLPLLVEVPMNRVFPPEPKFTCTGKDLNRPRAGQKLHYRAEEIGVGKSLQQNQLNEQKSGGILSSMAKISYNKKRLTFQSDLSRFRNGKAWLKAKFGKPSSTKAARSVLVSPKRRKEEGHERHREDSRTRHDSDPVNLIFIGLAVRRSITLL